MYIQPSEALYFTMWDASIYWTNGLGWTYYDFTVRFFVCAPLIAMGGGLILLLARGCQRVRRWAGPTPSSDDPPSDESVSNKSPAPADDPL